MSTLSSRRNIAGHLEFYDTDGNLVKIEYTGGTTAFFKNGEWHRDDGPAIIDPTNETWYQNGVLHRIDGPAIIYFEDGRPEQQFWIQNGLRHRTDGPAIEYFNKDRKEYDSYYINGEQLSKEEFDAWKLQKH